MKLDTISEQPWGQTGNKNMAWLRQRRAYRNRANMAKNFKRYQEQQAQAMASATQPAAQAAVPAKQPVQKSTAAQQKQTPLMQQRASDGLVVEPCPTCGK